MDPYLSGTFLSLPLESQRSSTRVFPWSSPSSFICWDHPELRDGMWRLVAFEQFTSESSQVPQTLPAFTSSTPWVLALPWVPGSALGSLSLQQPLPHSRPSGSLSHPFYRLKFFRSLSPSMHATSLNFPDSGHHQQQLHRNTARSTELAGGPDAPVNTAFRSQRRTQLLEMT